MPAAIGRDKTTPRAVLAPENVNLYETPNKAYDGCLVINYSAMGPILAACCAAAQRLYAPIFNIGTGRRWLINYIASLAKIRPLGHPRAYSGFPGYSRSKISLESLSALRLVCNKIAHDRATIRQRGWLFLAT